MIGAQENLEQFVSSVEREVLRLAPELVVRPSGTSSENQMCPSAGPSVNLDQNIFASRLVVALSGGPDSTALLLAMSRICVNQVWELHAVHINHQTRGQESARDEAFCRKLCSNLNINLIVVTLDSMSGARSENALRQARYAQLERAAGETGASCLLTAHTLDDQAQTVLFRLFRGTGTRGLAGIPARRQLSTSLAILRPLLTITAGRCRNFLEAAQQQWVEDSSNAKDDYARNYIRHHIIPLIEQRFPRFQERVVRLSNMVALEQTVLEQSTQQDLNRVRLFCDLDTKDNRSEHWQDSEVWSLEKFKALPEASAGRLIADCLNRLKLEVSFNRVEMINNLLTHGHVEKQHAAKNELATTCGATSISLSPSIRLKVESGCIIWECLNPLSPMPVMQAQTANCPGLTFCLGQGKVLDIRTCEGSNTSDVDWEPNGVDKVLVDLSRIKFPLTLRARQSGDTIQPLGMKQRVRLKKFIHTRKLHLDPDVRMGLPVLTDQDDILWVPGCGLSEKVKVTNGRPTHRLCWCNMVPVGHPDDA